MPATARGEQSLLNIDPSANATTARLHEPSRTGPSHGQVALRAGPRTHLGRTGRRRARAPAPVRRSPIPRCTTPHRAPSIFHVFDAHRPVRSGQYRRGRPGFAAGVGWQGVTAAKPRGYQPALRHARERVHTVTGLPRAGVGWCSPGPVLMGLSETGPGASVLGGAPEPACRSGSEGRGRAFGPVLWSGFGRSRRRGASGRCVRYGRRPRSAGLLAQVVPPARARPSPIRWTSAVSPYRPSPCRIGNTHRRPWRPTPTSAPGLQPLLAATTWRHTGRAAPGQSCPVRQPPHGQRGPPSRACHLTRPSVAAGRQD